jgi:hypothetical protein
VARTSTPLRPKARIPRRDDGASREAFSGCSRASASKSVASTTATYTVPADAPPGCYSFSFDTTSRAFNPAGYDGGYAADWNYDNPWPLESNPSVSVAVVGP